MTIVALRDQPKGFKLKSKAQTTKKKKKKKKAKVLCHGTLQQ
jgi:hypothetical protein